MKRLPKLFLLAAFLTVSVNLFSCSPTPQLPESAEEALLAYWQSLPSSQEVAHRIVRVWPGIPSPEKLTPAEVWCVETEISAQDPAVDGEPLIWIIMRENENEVWSAALLATMSSIWPYEACGWGP